MTTTDKEKPGGKIRQRSQKGSQRGPKPEPRQNPKLDQRGQKPEARQSPKPDQRDNDQIGRIDASTDAPTNGAVALTNGPLVVAAAPADAPSIGATAPADPPSIGAAAPADTPSIDAATPADTPSIAAAAPADTPSIEAAMPADNCPVSVQTIANAYVDYARKSLQESTSLAGKLMGVRSFDNAIEVQTEFTRQALANFVAESQKLYELYGKLATQIFRPWQGLAPK
jgi:phasin family protein